MEQYPFLSSTFGSEAFVTCLCDYVSFLQRCYGPKGTSALVRNSAGTDILTSSSSDLLDNVKVHNPAFKYINAVILAQNKLFGVHGLYSGILCGSLLKQVLILERDIPTKVIKTISTWICRKITSVLDHHFSKFAVKVDLGQLGNNVNVVKSIVNSKNHQLSVDEVEHVCLKIVESHLKTIPLDGDNLCSGFNYGKVHTTPILGETLDTNVVNGILVQIYEKTFDELEQYLGSCRAHKHSCLSFVLFNIALSSDNELLGDVSWDGEECGKVEVTDYILSQLCHILKEYEVSLIFSQKYIQPGIKFDLERKGFLVFERLGTSSADALQKMTGCAVISSLTDIASGLEGSLGTLPLLNPNTIGSLKSLRATSIKDKCYLNLEGSALHCSHITLVLAGINEVDVNYLTKCSESSLNILRITTLKPNFCPGAGCFDAILASCISNMANDSVNCLSVDFDVHDYQINLVFNVFIDVFISLSMKPSAGNKHVKSSYMIDTKFNHLWAVKDNTSGCGVSNELEDTCVCGLILRNGSVEKKNWRTMSSIRKSITITDGEVQKPNCVSMKNMFESDSSNLQFSGFDGLISRSMEGFRTAKGCPPVVDSSEAKTSVVKLALESFSQLYGIGNYITVV